ncbi:MAG: aminopeptidase [Candidatus Jordarchaeum sp.]|uniref:aminopeptidase n=1 Tax=Candidatus Jordarchaeum sp. TaxID=2823881 RepID=UPI00404A9066
MKSKKGAKVIIETCMGVKPGENVLFVTQEGFEETANILASEVSVLKANPVIKIVKGSEMEVEPPQEVVDLMLSSDVILAVLDLRYLQLFAHMNARARATNAGARAGLVPFILWDITEEDVLRIKNLTERLAEIMGEGKEARISTALGTDVIMSIKGRPVQQLKAVFTEPGEWGAVPFYAEAAVAPIEGTTQGKAVIDVFMERVGAIKQPMEWTIKDGKLVEIKGGKEADMLKQIIKEADENATNIGELGVGTNHFFKNFTGTIGDKMVLGTIHLAIGKSINIGGKVMSNIHHDAVINKATLEIDGKKVLDRGKCLI